MNKIKAVIFDMDGVLIDAKEWHYEALNRALQLFGFNISKYEHLVTYDGLPTKKKLEMLSLEQNLPYELHSFINEMKQIYTMEIIYAKCKPMFQHEFALSQLKAKGYKLGVASNSIRKTIDVMMEKSNLMKYLDVILSNQDVKEGKPSPEIYQKAIKKLELSPKECLVVEDNINGIRSAKEAGAYVLKVLTVQDVTIDNIMNAIDRVERGED